MKKQVARDIPIYSQPWLIGHNIDANYDVKHDHILPRSPSFVNYSNMKSRDLSPSSKKDGLSTLDYKPNKDFTLNRSSGSPDMARAVSRGSHFFTKINKYDKNLTSNIDFNNPVSTLIASPERKRVDILTSNSQLNTIDMSKSIGRKESNMPETIALDYQVSYDYVEVNKGGNYSMNRHSERKPFFRYPWLQDLQYIPQRTMDKHYDAKYEFVENHLSGVPSIGRTQGRIEEEQKKHAYTYTTSAYSYDLSYTPSFKLIDMHVPKMDLFLNIGRVNNVKSISKSVDSLISRVNHDMRKYGLGGYGVSHRSQKNAKKARKEKKGVSASSDDLNMQHEESDMTNQLGESNKGGQLEDHFKKITDNMIIQSSPNKSSRKSSRNTSPDDLIKQV